jgi:hypothetical protein
MRKFIFIATVAFAIRVNAQTITPPKPEPAIGVTPEAIVWTDAAPTLPAGTKMAVLEGNPRAAGMFTMRLRIPAGSAIPPHWHPRQERVTVLSGAVDLGFGSTANAAGTIRYRAGSFYVNPPRVMHYLFFPEATEIQLTGVGPWELQTSDITAQNGSAATATVTVHNVTPSPGSELLASSPVKMVVDYEIRGFHPSTFFLAIVFESTTPNRSFGVGKTVVAGPAPLTPPLPDFLTTVSGSVPLTQEMVRVLANPELKRPIRLRVLLQEQTNGTMSRTAGSSDWIEFR